MNKIERLAKVKEICERTLKPHEIVDMGIDYGIEISKPQPDEDEIERDKISKSNAIGMGLIEPDQSRLLTRADMIEIIKEHWSDPVIVGACLSMTNQIAKAQLAKDDARIGALIEETRKELNNILGMTSERSPRWRAVVLALEALLSTLELKAVYCKGLNDKEVSNE